MKQIVNNIHRLLEINNISEPEFCAKFGVKDLAALPLGRLSELVVALACSPNQLLFGGILQKAFPNNIKLLILDVDGVMTDAGMYCSESGDLLKKFNAKDGMGILQLTKNDFQVGIISSGFHGELVKKRAELLKIQHFYLGREPKLQILETWCQKLNLSLEQVAIIGDDVNDLAIMELCGYAACPADAVNAVKKVVDCVLSKNGGQGCVREFIEEVMGVPVSYHQ